MMHRVMRNHSLRVAERASRLFQELVLMRRVQEYSALVVVAPVVNG